MPNPAKASSEPIKTTPGDLSQARDDSTSIVEAPGDLDPGRRPPDIQSRYAGEISNGNGQYGPDDQWRGAVPANLNGDQSRHDTQARIVAAASEDGQCGVVAQTTLAAPSEALLGILADALDDLERQRIATENRLRSLRQVKHLEGSTAEARLEALFSALLQLEHGLTLELKRAMRQHPLGPFVKRTVGLGEKQVARLLAAIGDLTWVRIVDSDGVVLVDRPRRGPAELWAYCGFHVVGGKAPKRRKGEIANWSTIAKTRAYLCAESCMKQRRSPYRAIYERERGKWAERETTDLHKHHHALRVVAKEILKDLWRETWAIAAPAPTEPPPAPAEDLA